MIFRHTQRLIYTIQNVVSITFLYLLFSMFFYYILLTNTFTVLLLLSLWPTIIPALSLGYIISFYTATTLLIFGIFFKFRIVHLWELKSLPIICNLAESTLFILFFVFTFAVFACMPNSVHSITIYLFFFGYVFREQIQLTILVTLPLQLSGAILSFMWGKAFILEYLLLVAITRHPTIASMILATGTVHFLLSDECSYRSILDGISPITVHKAGCMEAPNPLQVEEETGQYPKEVEMSIQYSEESRQKILEALHTQFETMVPDLNVIHKRHMILFIQYYHQVQQTRHWNKLKL